MLCTAGSGGKVASSCEFESILAYAVSSGARGSNYVYGGILLTFGERTPITSSVNTFHILTNRCFTNMSIVARCFPFID